MMMDEREEQRLAEALGRFVDGGDGDASVDVPVELREAREAADYLGRGLEGAAELDAGFDRRLRGMLVAEASRRRPKVVPLFRRSWFGASLTAALLVAMLTPYYWFYMRPRSVELQTTYRIKMERLENYDKMYVSKLSVLRNELRAGEGGGGRTAKSYFSSRRDSRVRELINRHRRSPSGAGGGQSGGEVQ